MVTDDQLREAVLKYGSQRAAAKALGVAESTLRGRLGKIPMEGEEVHKVETDNELDLFVLSPRIQTKEEAIRKASLDEDEWVADKVEVRSWETGCKVETIVGGKKITRGVAVTPLFGICVKLKRRTGWSTKEFREILLSDMQGLAGPLPDPRSWQPSTKDVMVEVSLMDAHIGKLAWHKEVGENYDLEIGATRYRESLEDLLENSSKYSPSRILYVVGNDMIHVDMGRASTTNAGTRQDCDGRWQRAYRLCRVLCSEGVKRCREVAPVTVLVLPGNHDTEKMFCLGDALEAQFELDSHVKVDNRPTTQKVFMWGKCMIAFEHGQNVVSQRKRNMLPLDLATKFPKEWAKSVHREVHLGHLHHEKEDVHRISDTIGKTIIRTLPSLSGPDAWHYENKYSSIPSAEAFVWHKKLGRRAILHTACMR